MANSPNSFWATRLAILEEEAKHHDIAIHNLGGMLAAQTTAILVILKALVENGSVSVQKIRKSILEALRAIPEDAKGGPLEQAFQRLLTVLPDDPTDRTPRN